MTMTVNDYEIRIKALAAKYKKCSDVSDKKILMIRGKLLRMAQNKLKSHGEYAVDKKDLPYSDKDTEISQEEKVSALAHEIFD